VPSCDFFLIFFFVESSGASNVTDSNMNRQSLSRCFPRSGCQKPPYSKKMTGWVFSAYLDHGFPKASGSAVFSYVSP